MWYNIVFSICVAAFFAGLVLTILLFILSASNIASHGGDTAEVSSEVDSGEGVETDTDADANTEIDSSVDTDVDTHVDMNSDLGTDVDADVDTQVDMNSDVDSDVYVDLNGDVDTNVDTHIDTDSEMDSNLDDTSTEIDSHEMDAGHIHDTHALEGHEGIHHIDSEIDGNHFLSLKSEFLSFENRTPISLVFSLYLLWFGAVGVFSYDFLANKFIWLTAVLIVPVGITKLISIGWKKIAKNTAYRVRVGNDLLGLPGVVKIDVSAEGGVISVKSVDTVQQLPVRSLFPLSWFYAGDTVYICDFKDGVYLVDTDPDNVVYPSKRK